jgi:predicted SPOUT superfamily RNA methylase MTH1
MLAQSILGPAATVENLVDYVNEKIPLPREYPIMPRTLNQMGQLTRTMRWPMVDTFQMSPVNSPAVLIHWRIMMAIVCTMSPEKRLEFKTWGKEDLAKLEKQVNSRRVTLQREDQESLEQSEDRAEEEDEWTVLNECWSGEEDEKKDYEILIKEGYSIAEEEDNKVRTGGTVTLLKGPRTIVVNTGHTKDKDAILESLERNGVSVDDVECCV